MRSNLGIFMSILLSSSTFLYRYWCYSYKLNSRCYHNWTHLITSIVGQTFHFLRVRAFELRDYCALWIQIKLSTFNGIFSRQKCNSFSFICQVNEHNIIVSGLTLAFRLVSIWFHHFLSNVHAENRDLNKICRGEKK